MNPENGLLQHQAIEVSASVDLTGNRPPMAYDLQG